MAQPIDELVGVLAKHIRAILDRMDRSDEYLYRLNNYLSEEYGAQKIGPLNPIQTQPITYTTLVTSVSGDKWYGVRLKPGGETSTAVKTETAEKVIQGFALDIVPEVGHEINCMWLGNVDDGLGNTKGIYAKLGAAIPDMLYAVADSEDGGGVVNLSGTVALPSGTPTASATKAYNKFGIDIDPGVTELFAIKWLGQSGATDWVVLPFGGDTSSSSGGGSGSTVEVVLIDGTSGGQVSGDPVGPIVVNGNPTRVFSGTLVSSADIWVRVNDHKRKGRLWLTKDAAYKGLLVGVYDPNVFDSENYPTPDSRPLYTIDPESDGETVAVVTTQASSGSGLTPSTDGRCTTYYRGSTGSTHEDETGVEFSNYFENPIPVGSVILLEEFQGKRVCSNVLTEQDQYIAKLTTTVTKRVSDTYGSATGVSLGYLVSGIWTEVSSNQTVYNPSLNPVHVPSGVTIQIPVGRSNGHWVLQNATDLQQVRNWTTSENQFVMHCAATTEYEWKDGDPILELQTVDSTVSGCLDLQLQRTCDTSWDTWGTVMECLTCTEFTFVTSITCDTSLGLVSTDVTVTLPVCPSEE